MKPARIVVVEDERIVALHLQQQLASLDYEVAAVAASGRMALDHIVRERPDVVLMDIHIQGDLDGIETASRIPADLQVPVIYLTAYSEETTLRRARATRPYGYLIKPYSERELHATIQMALERRRVESALRTSEDRFRSIVGAISEGIFIADAATGAIIEVNPSACSMFACDAEDLIGETLNTLSSGQPPYAGDAVDARVAAAAGAPQRFDWRCRRRTGEHFWAEMSVRVAAIGRRDMVLAVVRDLTERKAIEEQLRQVQKIETIGQLTGGIAHDFNNLLGVIIGNLDLLRDARGDDEEFADLSTDALDAALRGADLTRQLLAFARRQPLQPQTVELNELVDGTMRLLRRVLGENIEVFVSHEEARTSILIDRAQLESALTNLATNARDAMPRGGKLIVTTGLRSLDRDYAAMHPDVAAGPYALIEVTDTGTGMSEAVKDRIFEPFYTTKDRDRGTGLGLSMVFGFLKQSGGHVSVYSEPGVGSTFRLYLPSASGGVAMSNESVVVEPLIDRDQTALVVEDDTPIRRIAVRYFRELGYHVIEARNAAEALSSLESNVVDVMFTDVMMPGDIDGFELARQASEAWPALRVILTSGFPQTKLTEELAQNRFKLLSKPYRRADLAQVLQDELDQAWAAKHRT
jgi:two-component system, cell cycle sensor histidine kinase and response regulator CckA